MLRKHASVNEAISNGKAYYVRKIGWILLQNNSLTYDMTVIKIYIKVCKVTFVKHFTVNTTLNDDDFIRIYDDV